MSSPGDLVLSDVHLSKAKPSEEVIFLDSFALYRTDFRISCHTKLLERVRQHLSELAKLTGGEGATLDDDGDIVLPRRQDHVLSMDSNGGTLMLRIHHSMETQLGDVGMQVWMGALLMVDFILDKSECFIDKRVLELGGGAGISSLIAGMIAKSVTVTDKGKSVLRLCEMNYQVNKDLICCSEESFVVKELDWFNSDENSELERNSYDCIIACDVIYDNELTDAFFRTVYKILSITTPVPVVYIALEKRLNFTVAELDVTCKEYDHFRSCLRQLKTLLDPMHIDKIDTSTLSKHCNYERTDQLELWMIRKDTGVT